MFLLIFFFFKQKTAYEMRISDWSSDVCSSDLWQTLFDVIQNSVLMKGQATLARRQTTTALRRALIAQDSTEDLSSEATWLSRVHEIFSEIGRASCRESVCKYV